MGELKSRAQLHIGVSKPIIATHYETQLGRPLVCTRFAGRGDLNPSGMSVQWKESELPSVSLQTTLSLQTRQTYSSYDRYIGLVHRWPRMQEAAPAS